MEFGTNIAWCDGCEQYRHMDKQEIPDTTIHAKCVCDSKYHTFYYMKDEDS